MGKNKNNTPVTEEVAGVNLEMVNEVVNETPADTTETVDEAVNETPVVNTEMVNEVVNENPADTTETVEAEIIPSGRFLAESGDEYEFAVDKFTFQQKVYSKEEALKDHPDVLEKLVALKSFILKQV